MSVQTVVAGFTALAMLLTPVPVQAGSGSFVVAVVVNRLSRSTPAAARPIAPVSVSRKPAVPAQTSERVNGGGGRIIKPPTSSGVQGSGTNSSSRTNGLFPIARFGSGTVQVSESNNWLLWYLILSGSHNAHGVHQNYRQDLTSDPDYELVRFSCEPRPGQTAFDWQNECRSDSGQYRLRMNKKCYHYVQESAKNRIERCAAQFSPDF